MLVIVSVESDAPLLVMVLVPPVVFSVSVGTEALNVLRSNVGLLASPCPIVSGTPVGYAVALPSLSVPTETIVVLHTLPAPPMVHVPPSVLFRMPVGMLIVPLIAPVPVPRTNKVPVNAPPSLTLPFTVRLLLVLN